MLAIVIVLFNLSILLMLMIPTTIFFVRPSKLAVTQEHHVISKGELCRSFCLQIGGGLRPPNHPPHFNAIRASIVFHHFRVVFIIFISLNNCQA